MKNNNFIEFQIQNLYSQSNRSQGDKFDSQLFDMVELKDPLNILIYLFHLNKFILFLHINLVLSTNSSLDDNFMLGSE